MTTTFNSASIKFGHGYVEVLILEGIVYVRETVKHFDSPAPTVVYSLSEVAVVEIKKSRKSLTDISPLTSYVFSHMG